MLWFTNPSRSFKSINRLNRRRIGKAVSQVAAKALGRSENLESRRMLVNYTGTAAADTFLVQVGGGNVTVTVNGVPDIRADAAVATIVIDALGGNDTITLLNNDTTNPTTINAGDGVDSIVIGGGNYTNNIDSTIVITDGAVSSTGDIVTFADTTDVAGNDTYTMTAIRTFVKPTSSTTTWTGMENIVVNGSPIASTYDVRTDGASSLGGTTINGGAAADTINVGNGLDLGNAIDANLFVNGGLGNDSVTLDDSTETTATTYTMDVNGIGSTEMGGSIRISFSSIGNMTLNGSTGVLNDTYNVTDLNGVSFVTVNGGDGNDTLNYGDGILDTNTIDVSMSLAGGLGTDRINYNGQNFSGSETYTITSTTIDTSLSGLLTYGTTVETVVINADAGATVFNVNSTSAFATMSINAGDGDDTINVGATDFALNVNNDITVTGGGGNDLLVCDDSATAVNRTWTYQFGSVGLPGDTVFYTTLFSSDATERISVSGGSGADTFNIPSSSTLTDATLNGGGGNDTVNVSNTTQNLDVIDGGISVVGGAGTDSVLLSDDSETTADTYSFLSTGFTSTGMANSIRFSSDVDTVDLVAGVGIIAQTFDVAAMADVLSLTINCGDGNDSITVGGGDWATSVLSRVSVLAGAGTDNLTVNDTNDNVNSLEVYRLAINSLVKDQAGASDAINWTTALEALTVNTTQFADSIIVESTNNNTQVTFNGGAGNDTLDVSDNDDIDLDVVGNISFFGGADVDLLDLNDTGDTADADNYTVNIISFVKSNMATGDVIWNSTTDFISVVGNSGAGVYTVSGVNDGTSLSVSAGGGNDTIQNDAGNDFSFDWEDASITLSGGGGTDSLDLDDTASPTTTYGIDNNFITTLAAGLNGPVSVFYDLLENVTLLTNSVASTINALGLDNEVAGFILNAGDGADTINIGGATGTDLDGLNFFGQATSIVIAGGLGIDSVVIHDTDAVVGDDVYQLTQTAFTVAFGSASPTVFNYASDVNNIRLIGSDIAHTWNIESTLSTTNVTLDGGAAADAINLAPLSDDLNSVDAPMTLRGNGGNDVLTLHDSLNATDATWSILNNNLQRSGDFFAGSGYNTIEAVNIDAGSAIDTFNVSSTFANVGLNLDGRNGNDVFNIASSNNMDAVDGDITVIGNAGTDSLNYSDTLNATITTYTLGGLGSQRITRTGAGTVAVSTLTENVTISTGSANNTIRVDAWSSAFTSRPTIIAGAGNDSITVGNGDYDSNIGTSVYVDTGLGNDTLIFNDATDNDVGDTYTLTSSSITDSGAAANVLSYSADLFTAADTVVLLLPSGAETVNITSSIGGTTSVSGGAGNDTVNAGGGDLDSLNGTLIVDGGADSDRFNLDNSLDDLAGTNRIDIVALSPTLGQLTNTDFTPIDIAQWTNTVEIVALTDGVASTTFNVTSLPTPVRTSINGGDGNDTFNAGGGDIDLNLAGGAGPTQRFEGGNGTDVLNFDDSTDDAGGDFMLVRATFIDKNGQVVNYGTMEAMNILGSQQPTTYDIGSILATTPTSIAGGAGNDTFSVGNDIDAGLLGATTLTGNGGVDSLNLNDIGDAADPDAYNFATAGAFDTFIKTGSALLSYSVENATLDANAGNNVITVNAKSAGLSLTLNGNSGDDNLAIADGGTAANPIIVSSGAGADTVQSDSDADAVEAYVRFAGSDEVARALIGIGSTLRNGPGNSTFIVTTSFSIGGAFDVDAGFFISRVGLGTLAAFNNLLGNGYNGGTWNGVSQAFSSSAANASARADGLGIRLATDPNLPGANIITFGGQAVNPGDFCIGYVQNGDTDLDRDVDFDDLLRVAQNYGLATTRMWTHGSFDYDNDVDFDDLLGLAQNYGLPFLRVSPTSESISLARESLAEASRQRGMSASFRTGISNALRRLESEVSESAFTATKAIT